MAMWDYDRIGQYSLDINPDTYDVQSEAGAESLVNDIYEDLFGRTADTEGLEHYKGLLMEGEVDAADMARHVMGGARNSDEGSQDETIMESKSDAVMEMLEGVDEIGPDLAAQVRQVMQAVNQEAHQAGKGFSKPNMRDFIDQVTANNNPVAEADSFTATVDEAAGLDVLANDSDPDGDTITLDDVELTASPEGSSGSIAIDEDNQEIDFSADTAGDYTFLYSISDGEGGTATAEATVTVEAANEAPVAAADSFTVAAGEAADLDVLANDSDPDGDTLTLADTQLISAPEGAESSIAIDEENQDIDFSADTAGDYTFLYSISDGQGGTASTEVSVTVEGTQAEEVSVDELGTQQNAEALDADEGTIQYTDDGDLANYVDISNFDVEDDAIEYTNATADDVVVDAGTDTTLTFNNDGTVSQITLVGVESGLGTGVSDLDYVTFA